MQIDRQKYVNVDIYKLMDVQVDVQIDGCIDRYDGDTKIVGDSWMDDYIM